MSTDLKIELFGEDLFKYLYEHHGIGKGPSKGKKHPPRKSEFTEKIFRAVQVRMAMCHYTYEGIIENTHWEFSGNWSDFFDTIVFQFPHYVDWERNPSPEVAMSVFLYSCAFVADMVLWSRMKGDNFLYVGPKAWAMFVDLYMKKKFYAYGGWKKLHQFVEHDTVVHDYMKTFSEEVDCVLGKAFMFHTPFLTCGAVDSFDEFEASLEGVDDDAPMALKWVDYCVKVPFTKIRDSKFYYPSDSDVFLKLEIAMLDLGYILNPDREGDYFEGDSDPMWSGLDVRHQSSVLINDNVENDHILEKSLKLLEHAGKIDLSRPTKERECGLGDRRISHDNSNAEIYQVNERENSSGDSTVENQFKLTPGAAVEKTNKTEIPLDCGKPLKTENEMTTAETTHENPIGIYGKKAKKKKSKNELNFDDSNKEASQTSQSENTTAEPVLENPLGLSSEPQDAGKKVKKKKKRISRLEQRVKEEGDCVHDVTRLILVMGHQPGMESVASAFHNSKKQTPKDDNQNEK